MEIFVSNSGHEFIILSQDGKNCTVQFIKTGSIRKANIDNIRAGKVKDKYAITSYGVGYDGDFVKVPHWKQAKQLWRNMLKRCYCEKDEKGYFGRVAVCARWYCFANFLEDISKLDKFDLWLKGQSTVAPKYNLDKDSKIPGCTVYAPESCCFLLEGVNKAQGARNGKPYTKKQRPESGQGVTPLV